MGLYFIVNDGGNFEIEGASTILNATFKRDLFVKMAGGKKGKKKGEVVVYDCFGKEAKREKVVFDGWTHLNALPGCMIEIDV